MKVRFLKAGILSVLCSSVSSEPWTAPSRRPKQSHSYRTQEPADRMQPLEQAGPSPSPAWSHACWAALRQSLLSCASVYSCTKWGQHAFFVGLLGGSNKTAVGICLSTWVWRDSSGLDLVSIWPSACCVLSPSLSFLICKRGLISGGLKEAGVV